MATRKVYASYQEIIDLSTEGGANGNPAVTAIGIHTPTGYTPHKMFPGFFQQYKRWKYLGCSLIMVPAATLPVDPLAVGYEAGEDEQYIDMRDVLNPIMFHGCHGDDLGTILNTLYAKDGSGNKLSDSANFWIEDGTTTHADLTELLEGVYYKALTDMSWKKADPQRGFKKSGFRPLLYSMATNQPILPSAHGNGVIVDADGDVVNDGGVYDLDGTSLSPENVRQFFTPRLTRLGWMDTRLPYGTEVSQDSLLGDSGEYDDVRSILQGLQNYATLPKIFMGVLLLPPAYRVKQWFRLVLTHRFAFAGFRPASMTQNILGAPGYFRDLDYSTGGVSNDDIILGGSDDPEPEPDPPTPVLKSVEINFTNNYPLTVVDSWQIWVDNEKVWESVNSVAAGGGLATTTISAYTGSAVYVRYKLEGTSNYSKAYNITTGTQDAVEITADTVSIGFKGTNASKKVDSDDEVL